VKKGVFGCFWGVLTKTGHNGVKIGVPWGGFGGGLGGFGGFWGVNGGNEGCIKARKWLCWFFVCFLSYFLRSFWQK
jgi:hypothetical protein